MPRETLRLTRVAMRVVFLPRLPFAPRELTDLFAAVSDQYGFADFHRDTDVGAVMETPGGRRLEVRRDSVEYADFSPGTVHQVKQDVVALLGEVQNRLAVQSFANPSYTLQASLGALPAGSRASHLFAPAAVLDERSAGLLESTRPLGVGMRLTGRSDKPGHDWRVVLEPDATDRGVSVELVTDFHLPAESPGAVGEHLQQTHHFLTGNVAAFVGSLLERAAGDP